MNVHDDVVDGNVDQLDKKADEAHEDEAHADSLGDLDEFWACRAKKGSS
jgi:hypothetical protein